MRLNPPQQQAVACRRGPLLVLAGPGSGKTATVTHRTAGLLSDGVDPASVLLVTFTRKAAAEMRARIRKLVGGKAASGMWIGTFHATCAKLLRQMEDDSYREGRKKDFVIYDQDDSKALVKDAINSLNLDVKVWSPREVQNKISRLKNLGMQPEDLDPDDWWTEVGKRIWSHYELQLLRSNSYDYDDLQLVVMRLLESGRAIGNALAHRFEHVTVDEYQDTNHVQFRIVDRLAASRNLCVVGDHRQAIYAFRGADVRNILSFEQNYTDAKVVDLNINYRSTPQVVSVFNAFFDDCNMSTPNRPGPLVRVTCGATGEREADSIVSRVLGLLDDGVKPKEIAALYRVHALSRPIEERLRNHGIRYQVVGGLTFYERSEVKDVLAYLRLVENPHSNVDLQRVINTPRRAVSSKTVDALRKVAHDKGCSLWDGISTLLATQHVAPKTKEGLRTFQHAILRGREELTGVPAPVPPRERQTLDLFGGRPEAPPEQPRMRDKRSLVALTSSLLDRSGYREHWAKEVRKLAEKRKPVEHERALQKQANVEEVVAAVDAYELRAGEPTLGGFLEEVALMTDQDELKGESVSLMTVHASKGLEFDAVFVVGCEEGLLPFSKAIEEGSLDEELRLMFVACSRARKHLTLTTAATRFMYGKLVATKPSRFLRCLPEHAVDMDAALSNRLNGKERPDLAPIELKREEA